MLMSTRPHRSVDFPREGRAATRSPAEAGRRASIPLTDYEQLTTRTTRLCRCSSEVEQLFRKQRVGGSIPLTGLFFWGEESKGAPTRFQWSRDLMGAATSLGGAGGYRSEPQASAGADSSHRLFFQYQSRSRLHIPIVGFSHLYFFPPDAILGGRQGGGA